LGERIVTFLAVKNNYLFWALGRAVSGSASLRLLLYTVGEGSSASKSSLNEKKRFSKKIIANSIQQRASLTHP